MRWLVLVPEIILAASVVLSFGALLAAGSRAGRVARFALVGGCAAALAAAVLSRGAADEFLFRSYRIDPLSQLVKTMVLTGALLAATSSRGEDRWAAMRTTSPFFHLCVTAALVMAASTVDLLALSLVLWLSAVAAVLLASSVGRWSVLEKVVRRSLAGWLGALAATLIGGVIAAAAGQATRLEGLRLIDGVAPPAVVRAALALWCGGALWLLAAAPLQLRRLANDPSGSRAAPVLAGTALATAGGLLALRALSLAVPGLPPVAAALLLAVIVLPAPLTAARRFAGSFEGRYRTPAIGAALAGIAVAALVLWPWIRLAVGELD